MGMRFTQVIALAATVTARDRNSAASLVHSGGRVRAESPAHMAPRMAAS